MRLMHTRLPDMFTKLKAAAKLNRPDTEVSIRGLSDIQTGKVASLRVGRVESSPAILRLSKWISISFPAFPKLRTR